MESELLLLEDFVLNINELTLMMNKILSINCENETVFFDISHQLSHQLLCSQVNANKDCLTTDKILELFVERWRLELSYQNEVISLKDKVIACYAELCKKHVDNHTIDYINDKGEKVVNIIFELTKFDEKQKAGDFCKGLINGFEIDMINNIDSFIFYLLWKPFSTSFPIGLVQFISKTFCEEVADANELQVQDATTKIIQYAKDLLLDIAYEINNNTPIVQFEKFVEGLEKNRQTCLLNITCLNDVCELIKKYRHIISHINITVDECYFLDKIPSFIYNRLELTNFKSADPQKFFECLPKGLQELKLCFIQCECSNIQILFNYISKIASLTMLHFDMKNSNTHLSPNDVEDLGKCVKKLSKLTEFELYFLNEKFVPCSKLIELYGNIAKKEKCKVVYYIQELEVTSRETDKEIRNIAKIIKSMKSPSLIKLDFYDASITTNAIVKLANSLQNLVSIVDLQLIFSYGKNTICDEGVKALSKSINQMVCIKRFNLDFRAGQNTITDEGFAYIPIAMNKFKSIECLELMFGEGNNEIGDIGIIELSKVIKEMKNMKKLVLCFNMGKNKISDIGMDSISLSLKELTKMETFNLYIRDGKNAITDASMIELANALQQMSVNLCVDIWLNSENNDRVSEKGKTCIKCARDYKGFSFNYTPQQRIKRRI